MGAKNQISLLLSTKKGTSAQDLTVVEPFFLPPSLLRATIEPIRTKNPGGISKMSKINRVFLTVSLTVCSVTMAAAQDQVPGPMKTPKYRSTGNRTFIAGPASTMITRL